MGYDGIYKSQSNCRISKGYGTQINVIASASVGRMSQSPVQENLRWMNARFCGMQIWKRYRGVRYRGVVLQVGLHPARGYESKVQYDDGFVESVPVAVLVNLQNSRRIKEKINSSVQGATRIERCLGFQVGDHVVLDNRKQLAMVRPVSK